ncbi:MAG: diacylglycerol kinase family protein [Lachnospiraceae bacterium]|nr:diacylglycerol kinase family protein [Lachnospiraceae bacterium]
MKKQSGHRHPPLYKSFVYAFAGIFTCLKKERNIKIHLFMALMVTVFGFILKISVTEWCICLVLFGLIISLELVNTAVEAVVDLVTEEKHPLAGYAKDTAAGAVLAASIFAAVVGLIIFVPKLFAFLLNLLS